MAVAIKNGSRVLPELEQELGFPLIDINDYYSGEELAQAIADHPRSPVVALLDEGYHGEALERILDEIEKLHKPCHLIVENLPIRPSASPWIHFYEFSYINYEELLQVRDFSQYISPGKPYPKGSKSFICLNRELHSHREELLYRLIPSTQNYITAGPNFPESVRSRFQKAKVDHYDSELFTEEVFDTDRFYERCHFLYQGNPFNCNFMNYKFISERFPEYPLNLITETSINEFDAIPKMTEKTLYNFLLQKFFLILGKPGTLAFLKDRGFDIFEDLFDHSYDNAVHEEEKIDLLLSRNPILYDGTQLNQLRVQHWERLVHNRNKAISLAPPLSEKLKKLCRNIKDNENGKLTGVSFLGHSYSKSLFQY